MSTNLNVAGQQYITKKQPYTPVHQYTHRSTEQAVSHTVARMRVTATSVVALQWLHTECNNLRQNTFACIPYGAFLAN